MQKVASSGNLLVAIFVGFLVCLFVCFGLVWFFCFPFPHFFFLLYSNVVLPENAVVPANTLLHTIEVSRGKQDLFVTICFATKDDLKKKRKTPQEISFRDQPLTSDAPLWDPSAAGPFTLWDSPLFPLCESREESVRHALALASANLVPPPGAHGRCSMDGALLIKQIPRMLAFRRQLDLEIGAIVRK